VTIKKAWFE